MERRFLCTLSIGGRSLLRSAWNEIYCLAVTVAERDRKLHELSEGTHIHSAPEEEADRSGGSVIVAVKNVERRV